MNDMNAMNDEQNPETLTRILERYAISYEVRGESSVLRDHTVRQVGYLVDLYGSDGSPLAAGDERCQEIFRGLSKIARGILPPEGEDCCVSIEGFHPQLHFGVGGNRHGSVRLEMQVRHRHEIDRPVDAGEAQALKALLARLEALVGRGGRRSRGKAGAPAATPTG